MEREVLGPCSNFQASEIQSYTIENLSQSKYHPFQALKEKKKKTQTQAPVISAGMVVDK